VLWARDMVNGVRVNRVAGLGRFGRRRMVAVAIGSVLFYLEEEVRLWSLR
jgi:hypothetical protein